MDSCGYGSGSGFTCYFSHHHNSQYGSVDNLQAMNQDERTDENSLKTIPICGQN